MYVSIYAYIYICRYIYICIYIHASPERLWLPPTQLHSTSSLSLSLSLPLSLSLFLSLSHLSPFLSPSLSLSLSLSHTHLSVHQVAASEQPERESRVRTLEVAWCWSAPRRTASPKTPHTSWSDPSDSPSKPIRRRAPSADQMLYPNRWSMRVPLTPDFGVLREQIYTT